MTNLFPRGPSSLPCSFGRAEEGRGERSGHLYAVCLGWKGPPLTADSHLWPVIEDTENSWPRASMVPEILSAKQDGRAGPEASFRLGCPLPAAPGGRRGAESGRAGRGGEGTLVGGSPELEQPSVPGSEREGD